MIPNSLGENESRPGRDTGLAMKRILIQAAGVLILCGCRSAPEPPVRAIKTKALASRVDARAGVREPTGPVVIDVVSITAGGKRIAGVLPTSDLRGADDVVYDSESRRYFMSFNWSESRAVRLNAYDGKGKLVSSSNLPKSEWLMSFFADFRGAVAIATYDDNGARSLWAYSGVDKRFHVDNAGLIAWTPDETFDGIETETRRKLLKEIKPNFPIEAGIQSDSPNGPHGDISTDPEVWIAGYPVLSGRPDLPRVDFSTDHKLMAMATQEFLVARRGPGGSWVKDSLRKPIARALGIGHEELIAKEVQFRGAQVVFGFRISSRKDVFRTAICRRSGDGWAIEIVKARFVRAT